SNCSAEKGTTSNGCYFNDVDQGTISMACAVSNQTLEGGAQYDTTTNQWNVNATTWAAVASPNCTALNSGDAVGTLVSSGSTPAYNAGAAYDQASGLGSMNVGDVIGAWPASTVGSATAAVNFAALTPINSNQSVSVKIKVAGGTATPTGNLTLLASNSTFSAGQTLDSSGSATFTIPAYTFTASGTVTLTANYSGDGNYAAASNTTTLAVTYLPPGTYTIGSISPVTISSLGGTGTASVTVTASNGYSGAVTLSCTLTGLPSQNAVNYPTCSGNQTVTLGPASTSGTAQFTITTTKAGAFLQRPALGPGKGWLGAGSGAVLAFVVFLGIPARRRSWRAMLGMIAFALALGSFTACGSGATAVPPNNGGGGNTGGGGTSSTPGTTTGTYTFTVSASGIPAPQPAAATQTFSVTVQ
ncbi:MAG: Ig-like domain repeat protein, partial [Acidobacteriota bacterium]